MRSAPPFRFWVALLVIVVGLAPAASGGQADGLSFRRADGSQIVFEGRIRAWCGPWNDIDRTRSLHVAVLKRDGKGYARPFWTVFAVIADVTRVPSIPFPFGLGEPAHGAVVFVYDRKSGNEASSEQDDAAGRITFGPVRCTLGSPVRFTVTGKLGSEIDGKRPIRVTGTFRGVVGRAPAWFPK